MYKIITLTFLLTFNAISQELIINSSSLQPGFYRNYNEMKANQPSIKKTYPIKLGRESTSGMMGVGMGTKVDYYRFKITNKEANELEAIFGYSDGEVIYIIPRLQGDKPLKTRFLLKRERKANFRQLMIIGKYGYYQDVIEYVVGFRVNAQDPSKKERIFCFLDFENDNFIQMDYKRIKELIKQDRELWIRFKDDSKKRKNISQYIKEYILKNGSLKVQ